uniref:L1 transposable element RRM domain-containing protein n=1 Tax=Micrurus corallinus TaxID=54390 RepID=A0A2D4FZY8_MICCO
MERADFYLRVQNIEEEKGENLKEIMTEILAEPLEMTKEKVMGGMDEIYLIFTRYAMRNKLPREVHVRFTKKTIRTEILQKARDDLLKYKGKNHYSLETNTKKSERFKKRISILDKNIN